ncbi:MAG: HEAT repeat domain-containing protein, partial [Planctomycetota bacterium]
FKINEALELRGAEIDAEVRRQVHRARATIVRAALKSIDDMTLTVIDGDFPREVLARENLTFAEYHMPLERSDRKYYDANKLGQAEPVAGSLYSGDDQPREAPQLAAARQVGNKRAQWPWLILAVGAAMTGGLAAFDLPTRHRRAIVGGSVLIIVLTSLLAVGNSDEKIPALNLLVNRLGNPDTAEQAAEHLTQLGERAVPALIKQSRSQEIITQGWAIVCLGRIGSEDAKRHLERLRSSESIPPLVQTWAAAAMIAAASTTKELEELSQLVNGQPALSRPLMLAFQKQVRKQEGVDAFETTLLAASRSAVLAKSLAPEIMSAGPERLVREMLRSDNLDVRRTAAGYVASLGQQPDNARSVSSSIVAALRFDPTAEHSPWHNGPLFLPSIPWQTEDARALVGNLMRWHLWAHRHGEDEVRRQIDTNLQSVTLAGATGYQITNSPDTQEWLRSWKHVVGAEELKQILTEQGAEGDFAGLLLVD